MASTVSYASSSRYGRRLRCVCLRSHGHPSGARSRALMAAMPWGLARFSIGSSAGTSQSSAASAASSSASSATDAWSDRRSSVCAAGYRAPRTPWPPVRAWRPGSGGAALADEASTTSGSDGSNATDGSRSAATIWTPARASMPAAPSRLSTPPTPAALIGQAAAVLETYCGSSQLSTGARTSSSSQRSKPCERMSSRRSASISRLSLDSSSW